MEIRGVIINPADNVAVVVQKACEGDSVKTDKGTFVARQEIDTGHKIAIVEIKKGLDVIKYGTPIGRASQDIRPGDWVHTHNVIDTTEEICNAYAADYHTKAKEALD